MARRRDEPVRLTRIYTRGGDAGETSLGDGSRVAKTEPRIAAVGAVEETNAHIGIVLAGDVADDLRPPLELVQNDLFDVGADLAVPFAEDDGKLRIVQAQVDGLEELCDRYNETLPPLKSFILPGGGEGAARLHLARTVCRRAELAALLVSPVNPVALAYLNRLSDLLFILARCANAGRPEPLWKPGGSR
ncbi:MAG TPA: cob(I)yrinic acid a,c-diamide adenosyltransferase [Gaiellaceae bacterium]|nr:cob(I)yrinic acid a,c-diamide adenosyltransferase [Gaiellaceae bacterium]